MLLNGVVQVHDGMVQVLSAVLQVARGLLSKRVA